MPAAVLICPAPDPRAASGQPRRTWGRGAAAGRARAIGPGAAAETYLRATSERLITPYFSQASRACSVRNAYSFSRTSSTRNPAASMAPT